MYLQTSRLQYNLQGVGVFQKAHSDKNIQAEACRYIIPQNCEYFNTDVRVHIMRLKNDEIYGIIRYRNSGGNHAYLHIHIKRKIRIG